MNDLLTWDKPCSGTQYVAQGPWGGAAGTELPRASLLPRELLGLRAWRGAGGEGEQEAKAISRVYTSSLRLRRGEKGGGFSLPLPMDRGPDAVLGKGEKGPSFFFSSFF